MDKVDLAQKFSTITDYYQPRIAGELNDSYVKLVKLKGPFIWHHHNVEDELFLVVKGSFRMLLKEDGREREIKVGEGEFLIMPRGVEHKPVADEEVWVMLLEPKTTLNTGNVRNERTVENLQNV